MDFQKIDMDKFARRKHFDYFSSLQYPYVGLTANVDVTELVQFCKGRGYSFFLAFLHIVALSADEIREFRQRIRNKEIVGIHIARFYQNPEKNIREIMGQNPL